MSVLQTIDLKKYYGTEPNITRALDGVNFSVEDGEFVAVVGTSGSGKSTLLHMMGGLDTPTSGNVIVRDKELSKMNDEQLTIFRRRNIGFIFQNYNLVPILNVYENIVLPVELDGDTVDQKFLDEIVHLLGLEDKLKNMPNNLSGGQQQRVAIARALITKPAIVLADEPTGNLDSKTSAEVLGLIKRTSAEFRQTVVMITHNNDIARLADRIVRIEDTCFIAAIRCSMLEAESISFLKFSSSVLIDHETVTRPSFFSRSISRTTRSDFVQIRISASLPISCSRSFLVFPNCSSCGL